MGWYSIIFLSWISLLGANEDCDPAKTYEGIYPQGTEVDLTFDCTTNQVLATFQRNISSNGFSPLSVFYSCKFPNGTFQTGAIIDRSVAGILNRTIEIPCDSLCSFGGCYIKLNGSGHQFNYRISPVRTCGVCTTNEIEICPQQAALCPRQNQSVCSPSIHLGNGSLDCSNCVHEEVCYANKTTGISASEKYIVSSGNSKNLTILHEEYSLQLLLLLIVPAILVAVIASIIACSMALIKHFNPEEKHFRIANLQFHMDQPLNWEPQVSVINSKFSIPHSESVGSVFDKLYQEKPMASPPTGSSEQSSSLSLNYECPLKDEAGYITTHNSACSSQRLTKEDMCDCRQMQCSDELS